MNTTASHVPAGLPLLRAGVGPTPADGGCLVQVASWLRDGRSWTDEPPWLHPTLAGAAVGVNDNVPDGYRPVLGPLAADLAGLAHHRRRQVTVALAVWTARRVLPLDCVVRASDPARADLAAALDAAEAGDHRAGEWAVSVIGRGDVCHGAAEWAAVQACHTPTCHPASNTPWMVGHAAVVAVAKDAKLRHPGRTRAALLSRYEAQREFLAALLSRYRELTGPTGPDARRWGRVCELVGVTS